MSYDKLKKNKKISKAMKGIKRSQETKDKISKATKGVPKGPKSQESKDKVSSTMKKKASRGKKHYAYSPFVLVVESTKGETKEYTFDGTTPILSCSKRFNLGKGDILYKMKSGWQWVIKRRSTLTKHKFPIGTTLSMRLL